MLQGGAKCELKSNEKNGLCVIKRRREVIPSLLFSTPFFSAIILTCKPLGPASLRISTVFDASNILRHAGK